MNENKFSGKGKIYSQFRPSYPQECINYLYSSVGITEKSIIADIGSGTGIFTKQLLDMGNTVFAVEPNVDMRTVAENNLSQFKGFKSVNGTAENTSLESGSVDFITVAQAFHWFDVQAFSEECRRILRHGGKVILLWNIRDEGTPLIKDYIALNRKFCPQFNGFTGGSSRCDLSKFYRGEYESKVFKNPLRYDKQQFIGRLLSSSYALKPDDENYEPYVEAIEILFNKYSVNGFLDYPNNTECYIGKL